tara:strand:- start:433 stop:612 length:180 start_codon:yes stop_codon:yes gene_type:complete
MVIQHQEIELQFQLKHIQLQWVAVEQEQLKTTVLLEHLVIMVQIQFFQQSHLLVEVGVE